MDHNQDQAGPMNLLDLINPDQAVRGPDGPLVKIACFGSGYTAGITMVMMAYECVNVMITMLDVGNENLDVWEAGIVPFEEPDMQNMYDEVHNVRLRIGHDIAGTLNGAHCIVMAIDNPIQKINDDHELNLTKWEASWRRVANHAANKLVIEKSNVPIDADENIRRIFLEEGVHNYPRVLYNPDFYSLGTSYMDLRFPSQVIFGGNAQLTHAVDFVQFRNLLFWVPDNILFTYPDSKSVILAKLGINVLLAAKLSTLNSIASISAQVKANTHSIMDIMNRDQRLGPTYLKPGIGFGGPSLVRDTQFLSQVAHDNGLPEEKQLYVKILANNRKARRRFVNMVLAKLIGMKNKTIAIFGFASKHNTSDLTNSPAWKVCKMLLKHRVRLRIHDSEVPRARILRCFRRRVGQGRVVVTTSPIQAATNATAICILNDSDRYQNENNYVQLYTQLFAVMRHPSYIFDGRNLRIDWQPVTALGFSIHAVGKPSIGLGF